jgi:hypothetical protein
MSAEEFLNQNHLKDDWSFGEESLKDSLWTNNVLKYMKEFATLQCQEQRKICANELFEHQDTWMVAKKDYILNAENPKM